MSVTEDSERATAIIKLCEAIGNDVAGQMQSGIETLSLHKTRESYRHLFSLVAPSDPAAPETQTLFTEEWSGAAARAMNDNADTAAFVGANVGALLSLGASPAGRSLRPLSFVVKRSIDVTRTLMSCSFSMKSLPGRNKR
jgi:hypothetical protein